MESYGIAILVLVVALVVVTVVLGIWVWARGRRGYYSDRGHGGCDEAMSDEIKPGKETTEWGALQWVKWASGLVGIICMALAAALPASGAVPVDSPVVAVLAAAVPVCMAVAGKTASDYIKGRSQVKSGGGS